MLSRLSLCNTQAAAASQLINRQRVCIKTLFTTRSVPQYAVHGKPKSTIFIISFNI